MNCPIDNTELRITERQGIEIDYCPKCRGVWLDRGELDKMIERSATVADRDIDDRAYRGAERRDDWDDPRDRDDRPYEHGSYPPSRRRKRRSFLDDLFDFDD